MLSGELDIVVAAEMRRSVSAAIEVCRGCRVVIDLAGVTFMDVAALEALVASRRDADRAGVRVELAHVPAPVRRLAQLTKTSASGG